MTPLFQATHAIHSIGSQVGAQMPLLPANDTPVAPRQQWDLISNRFHNTQSEDVPVDEYVNDVCMHYVILSFWTAGTARFYYVRFESYLYMTLVRIFLGNADSPLIDVQTQLHLHLQPSVGIVWEASAGDVRKF